MITEDYTDFETANLLKEKGFDEPCYAYWHEDENKLIISQSMHAIQNITNPCFFGPAVPTLQMVAKWLRIKHNLHCDIGYDFILAWCIKITSLKETIEDYYTEMKTYLPNKATNYPSYEEAYNTAIKYCVKNLI